MSSHLPYNPWEVKYTLLGLDIPLKPTAIHLNPTYCHPALVKFPVFPLLPAELRVRIWSFAAPHKRVVEIRSWGTGQYAPIRYSVHPHYLPAIFHVCKESRMEARRIYKRVGIGISATTRVKGQRYVDWRCHPANPTCRRSIAIGSPSLPYAMPHAPTYVYLSWEHDIIYLGPEFQSHHLLKFLTSEGEGRELQGLRYLAFDRKLWTGDTVWGDVLRRALWSLKDRENLSELIVIPDDEGRCLADRWYYGKHEITAWQPEVNSIRTAPQEWMPTFVGNLEEWFGRLWKDQNAGKDKVQNNQNDESGRDEEDKMAVETGTRKPPKVSVMSLKRDGQIMREFTDGLSDIQNAMGNMQTWKTWTPPASP